MAKLPYQVQCKSIYPFFETIAAFDCDKAAFTYAAACAETNPQAEYRVCKGRRILADSNACRPGARP